MNGSFYVRTDEGLELIVVKSGESVEFVPYNKGEGEGYRLTYQDGSGFDVYDYVSYDGSTKDFQEFMNRNLDR